MAVDIQRLGRGGARRGAHQAAAVAGRSGTTCSQFTAGAAQHPPRHMTCTQGLQQQLKHQLHEIQGCNSMLHTEACMDHSPSVLCPSLSAHWRSPSAQPSTTGRLVAPDMACPQALQPGKGMRSQDKLRLRPAAHLYCSDTQLGCQLNQSTLNLAMPSGKTMLGISARRPYVALRPLVLKMIRLQEAKHSTA